LTNAPLSTFSYAEFLSYIKAGEVYP
jgi:hypothetical protein